MAELTQQPKPVLRVITFTGILIVDVGLIIVPVIAWYTESFVLFTGLMLVLVVVFIVCYRWGINNLRKLLVAQ